MLLRWERVTGLSLAAVLGVAAPLFAQQLEVPRDSTAPVPGPAGKVIDPQHLKDRPYTGSLPKPSFPATERVQRSFTVAFVYDYAFAAYTPAAELPVVSKALVKRDTPENAAIAFFSAQRSGDWDAFLQCWAEPDRKKLLENLKAQNITPAEVLAKWKTYYNNRTVQLIDRIETTAYVILDAKISGYGNKQVPAVFKLVNEQWMVTNDLGTSGNAMMSEFRPELAGIARRMQPAPIDQMTGGRTNEGRAQRAFVDEHNERSEVVRAGR